MTREELQKQALDYIKENHRVALQWCTSLGKSKAAINIMNYLVESSDKPIKILLVVAETAHKLNWELEFRKWKLKTKNIAIECYASLHKYKDTKWDLAVFDEAHHLGSDIRLDIVTNIKASNIVLLSATLPDDTMFTLSNIFGKFKTSKVTLKKAIEWGILPEPKVYLLPLELDNKKYNNLIIEEWGKKEKRKVIKCNYEERRKYMLRNLYPDVTLMITCTDKQKYDFYTEQSEYWKQRYMTYRLDYMKNKWLQAGSKRKAFLGLNKTMQARKLLNKLKDTRYICFCSNIEQADILSGNRAIHSKRKNSLNILNDFNNKQFNHLFAVGMLQEGQNLVDIEAGIIIQLDGKERAFIQKMGRAMRAEDPIQYIFYYKDTQDETYLKNVIEGVSEEFIEYIDDINNMEV